MPEKIINYKCPACTGAIKIQNPRKEMVREFLQNRKKM